MDPKETLVYWINERETVRSLKDAGRDKPWSTDPVFQVTYFCNVHREDDRVTKWVREFYTPHVNDTYFEANICMARLVNKITSLQGLGYMERGFDDGWFYAMVDDCAAEKRPFWGNAYVVTTHGQKMSKAEYAVGVLEAAFDVTPGWHIPTTLGAMHSMLTSLEGFGSFMAAQVVADLKNTQGHPLARAEDWWWWSAPGPGSLRGLGWYYGSPVSQRGYDNAIVGVMADIKDRVPTMCMQDLQNCLCEYDKYMRVSNGTGRSKRKYDGS